MEVGEAAAVVLILNIARKLGSESESIVCIQCYIVDQQTEGQKKVFAGFGWFFDRRALHRDGGALLFVRNTIEKKKRRTLVARWLNCRGSRLRTPGIDCTSSKLRYKKHKNFCSLHCLYSRMKFGV